MRIAPIGLLPHEGRDKELLVADATRITHRSAVAQAAANAVAFAVAYLLGGHRNIESEEGRGMFLAHVRHVANFEPEDGFDFSASLGAAARKLDQDFFEFAVDFGTSGLSTESVVVAITAFVRAPSNFEALMELCTLCGGDTDSIAAIAGNLWGAHNGYNAIPNRFKAGVENRTALLKLCNQFYKLVWMKR